VPQPSTYVELTRTWKSGDKIEVTIPKSLRLEPTPDDPTVAAIMWGPLVLAGDHGPRRDGRRRNADGSATVPPPPPPIPVLVAGDRPLTEWLVPVGEREGNFTAHAVARVPAQAGGSAGDVPLAPFYRSQGRRYSVYFDVLTPAQFDAREKEIAAEREHQRRVEAATVGFVQPGEMQPERDYNYQSEPSRRVERSNGRGARSGTGWFSFDMPVDPSADTAIVVTYLNEQGLPPAMGNFDIQVDGTTIAHFEPNRTKQGFYDAQYTVPADLVKGKSKITVRFQASGTRGRIAPVFGVRTIRAGSV
jgi:Uncharacterized protein conserved in bacteria